jgi:hypothetical protein
VGVTRASRLILPRFAVLTQAMRWDLIEPLPHKDSSAQPIDSR